MNQNTIKVLLADDNKDFCDIIVDHLNKQEDITVVGRLLWTVLMP